MRLGFSQCFQNASVLNFLITLRFHSIVLGLILERLLLTFSKFPTYATKCSISRVLVWIITDFRCELVYIFKNPRDMIRLKGNYAVQN
jgi:hypothetical protein